MTGSEVKENIEPEFSKRKKKTEVKEKAKREKEDDEVNDREKEKNKRKEMKKRKGKDKEDDEMNKTKRKAKGKKDGDKEEKIGEEDTDESKEPSDGNPDADKFEALVIVPPDGGWGWIVVLSCFLILIVSDGTMNSYGAFSYHIEDEFHVKVAEISIISSIATCLYYVCGPVWGALGNRYGFRTILIIGAGVMAAGNLGAFFVKKAFFPFAVFYAVGVGTGGGMIFMSAYVMVGVYFERWRGYAISIVSCGSSLGTVFMPPAYNAISGYGWRFVLVLNCILLACCMLLGLFLRPLKPSLITTRPEPKQVQFKEKGKLEEKKVKGKPSPQVQHPRTQELMQTSSFVTLKGVGTTGGSATSVYISAQEGRPPPTPPTEEELDGAGARPMYRDDIFYPASAARLGSQTTYRMSGFSMMRLPTVEDVKEERVKPKRRPCLTCTCCAPGVRRVLATLLDASLLRSPVFLGIAISQTICMLGYHAPFLFTFSRAKQAGMAETHSAWLIPLMGITNTIGRLLCGAAVELPGVSALHLTGVSYAIGGLFTICSCFDLGYPLQFAYVSVFGLMAAAFMAMKSIILVDYLGIERLTNAFGLLLMFQGFASLCGPPLVGFIADQTQNFDNAFYCAGSIAFLGGLSGFIVIPLKQYEIRKGIRDR